MSARFWATRPFSGFAFQTMAFFLWLVCFTHGVAHAHVTPPQEIKGIDLVRGKPIEVRINQAKLGTVLIFLSSKCPCSASHQGVLNQIVQEFGSSGFEFVGVHSNADEPFDVARAYFGSTGLVFPVVQDEGSHYAIQLEALKTPHVFVINSNQQIVYQGGVDDKSRDVGNASYHYLRDALSAIRQGKEPSVKFARVLGCVIKRP